MCNQTLDCSPTFTNQRNQSRFPDAWILFYYLNYYIIHTFYYLIRAIYYLINVFYSLIRSSILFIPFHNDRKKI